MVHLNPRRLWSNGSTNNGPGYPHQIEIKDNGLDEKLQRREEREDARFWKEKAEKLEETVKGLEKKVAKLEKKTNAAGAAVYGDGPPGMSTSSAPAALSASIEKEEGQQQQREQRKDEIMQQLVMEMERIIELHTKGDGDSSKTDGDSDDHHTEVDLDKSISSDDFDGEKHAKLETAALEDLLSSLLANDTGASASAATKRKRSKRRKHKKKHKPKRVLYQLSCKQCIGQNFVSSTKSDDLKEKVKENFSVVWQVVRTAYGKGGGEENIGSLHEHSLSFRASSLAHHIADHCRECNSEEEVYQWCLHNIKVERISKHPLKRHDTT